jgi:hypothetical protein
MSNHAKSMISLASILMLTVIIFIILLNAIHSAPNLSHNLTMKLKWQQPNLFMNGAALFPDEIESYIISWGMGDEQTDSEKVDGSVREYRITNLEAGQYKISIQAITVYGSHSEPSYYYKTLDVDNKKTLRI